MLVFLLVNDLQKKTKKRTFQSFMFSVLGFRKSFSWDRILKKIYYHPPLNIHHRSWLWKNLNLFFCYQKNWIYFISFIFSVSLIEQIIWGLWTGKKEELLFVNVEWLCRSCIKSVKNLINLLGSLSINWRKLQKV